MPWRMTQNHSIGSRIAEEKVVEMVSRTTVIGTAAALLIGCVAATVAPAA